MHALKTGHTLGQYEILRLLGEGGMGAVYEARHTSLERRVAIKTLHANIASNQIALQRFFAEAKTLSRLEHHSIVQVSDFGTSPDGTVYLVMEYLRGDSLGKRLRKIHDQGQTFAPIHALQICWQVAEVLTIAHSKGIIHRDAYEKTMTCFRVSAKDAHRRRTSHGYSEAEDSSYSPLQLV